MTLCAALQAKIESLRRWNQGFDPRFARLSPGLVLQKLMLDLYVQLGMGAGDGLPTRDAFLSVLREAMARDKIDDPARLRALGLIDLRGELHAPRERMPGSARESTGIG